MVKEIKYGVISDVHSDPKVVPLAIDVLKRLGAERLLVNGDIGNQQRSLQDSQNYVAFILDSIGKSGLESFVQPGSHETLLAFGPVLEHFAEQYSNIIDATKNKKAEQEGHDLVFLSGSDFLRGGEYQIGNHEQIPSGRYIQTEQGLMQFEEFEQYIGALQRGIAQGAMQYANMGDLRKLITYPSKTIVICHVPRKFNDLETAVDMAEFGEATEDFELQGKEVKKGSVYPLPVAKQVVQAGYPVEIKRANRGNEDLRDVYEELGITKAVSGHFHEAGHRANDRNSNYVQEGQNVRELFWNSGYLSAGQTGILTVRGDEVNYRNIQLS